MKKSIYATAAAVLLAMPAVASAQALPAAVIAVVDVQRAMTTCNACKTALGQLQTQATAIRTLSNSLQASLNTEGNAIQTAANALNGKPADAALSARVQAFEKKQNDAQRQLQTRQQTFERNRSYVLQQISQKMEPILASVLTRRNATVMLDAGSIVRSSPAVDVTNDVIAGLNSSLTAVSVTAPAQAQTAPQGR